MSTSRYSCGCHQICLALIMVEGIYLLCLNLQLQQHYLKEIFTVVNTQKLNGVIGKVLLGAVTSKWLNATAILCPKKGNTICIKFIFLCNSLGIIAPSFGIVNKLNNRLSLLVVYLTNYCWPPSQT